jgi:hypothetical protein
MTKHRDHCHHRPRVKRLTWFWRASCACGWLELAPTWRGALILALAHADRIAA